MSVPGKFLTSLAKDFHLVVLQYDEFDLYYQANLSKLFSQSNSLPHIDRLLTEEEKAKRDKLSSRMGKLFELYLGIFKEDGTFVGWHRGDQQSAEEYYMRSSGVLPEFQGLGLYTSMLRCVKDICVHEGFQVISSIHAATNNRVIVPKLKAGFIIVGMELSEKFGSMVRLAYYPNKKRRAIYDYRSGWTKFDPQWNALRSTP